MMPLKWFTKGSLVNLDNPNSLYSTFFTTHVFFLFASDFQSKLFQLLEFWIVKVVPLWGCYRWWKDGRFVIQKACLKFLEYKSANAPFPPTFNFFKAAKAIQCTFVNILPSASGSSKLTNFWVSCKFFFGCKLGNRKQSWNIGRTRTTWSQVMVDFSFFVVVGEVGLGFPTILQICWVPTLVDYPRLKDLKPMLPCWS